MPAVKIVCNKLQDFFTKDPGKSPSPLAKQKTDCRSGEKRGGGGGGNAAGEKREMNGSGGIGGRGFRELEKS